MYIRLSFLSVIYLLIVSVSSAQTIKTMGKINLDKTNYPLNKNFAVKVSDDQFVIYQRDGTGACYLMSYDSNLKLLWKNRLKNNKMFSPDLFFIENKSRFLFFQNLGAADSYGCYFQEHDFKTGKRTNTVQVLAGVDREFKAKVSPNGEYFLITNLYYPINNSKTSRAIVYNKDWEVIDEQVLHNNSVVDVEVNNDGEMLALKRDGNNLVTLVNLFSRKMEDLIQHQVQLNPNEQIVFGPITQKKDSYYVSMLILGFGGYTKEAHVLSFDLNEYKSKVLTSIEFESKLLKEAHKFSFPEAKKLKIDEIGRVENLGFIIDDADNFYLVLDESRREEENGSNVFFGDKIFLFAFNKNGKNTWNTWVNRKIKFAETGFKFKKGNEAISPSLEISRDEIKLWIPVELGEKGKSKRNFYLASINKNNGFLNNSTVVLKDDGDFIIPKTGRLMLGDDKILLFKAGLSENSTFELEVLNLKKGL